MKQIMLLAFFCCITVLGKSQDVITKKNGDKINAKITALTESSVTYYNFDDPEKVEITISRGLISKIDFEYGKTEVETAPGLDESYYVDDNINNILVNVTSIASKSTTVGYERSLDVYSSISGYISIHGVGSGNANNVDKSGFSIEGNYKVKTGSIFKRNRYRPPHILEGFYLRPDLGYTKNEITYDKDSNYKSVEDYSYFYGGVDLGKEWIFNNRISLDLYGGINFFGGDYSYTTNTETTTDDPYIEDGNMVGSNGTAFRYGLQIGFVF